MTDAAFRVGVIGDPVAHSISPVMQQAALDFLHIPARYERWHTLEDELPARIESLRALDCFGANVTVPHKQAAIPFLDELTPLAERAGAVNTIINREGALLGENTDVHGFARSVTDAVPNVRVRNAVVVGAGGASRGVLLALEALGLPSVVVANRTPDRAETLAADLAPYQFRISSLRPDLLAREFKRTSLLVNATSVGWDGSSAPFDLELVSFLPGNALVVDLTYRDTPLLETAKSRGLATLDGLPMLVHQGARSLELWTGQQAPVDLMMAAAIEARDAAR